MVRCSLFKKSNRHLDPATVHFSHSYANGEELLQPLNGRFLEFIELIHIQILHGISVPLRFDALPHPYSHALPSIHRVRCGPFKTVTTSERPFRQLSGRGIGGRCSLHSASMSSVRFGSLRLSERFNMGRRW
mmetsp:Transcript_28897/g.47936  ORF Transcript_28897/g.47936 Transcript_28897/m.47936 type:complete len:132 (+) Transcript_28897:98-493(+)